MGRSMSSQRKPNLAAHRSNVQNWFHEDDGTISSTGLPPARPSKKSFEEEASFLRYSPFVNRWTDTFYHLRKEGVSFGLHGMQDTSRGDRNYPFYLH